MTYNERETPFPVIRFIKELAESDRWTLENMKKNFFNTKSLPSYELYRLMREQEERVKVSEAFVARLNKECYIDAQDVAKKIDKLFT